MRVAVLLAAALLLAGCSSPPEAPAPQGLLVEGWAIDSRLAPVPGVRVTAIGVGSNATTDEVGHFEFGIPPGSGDLLVMAEADGFMPQSRTVSAGSGSRIMVNFTLDRLPVQAPYQTVEEFDGILRCGIVAVAGEDPGRPHEHEGVRCSVLVGDDANQWSYPIPQNSTGLVIEAAWDAQSELSRSMYLNVSVEATGEVLGWQEGVSPLRAQPSRFKLDLERSLGNAVLDIRIESGAGTGNHEHGAVGAVVEQEFRLFVTAFYNGPVNPGYSFVGD
ncbi:MAG: carboxypeptidase-like regulatory domain-containing protein [Thermoplasmatota archaeon]